MDLLLTCIIIFATLLFVYLWAIRPNRRRPDLMHPFESVMIAHRGFFDNNTDYPENSLPAFARAVKAGYGIELDVQLTKDNQLVVFHDASLKRMCGQDMPLTSLTFEQLQKLTLAASNEKIPLLTDVLSTVDGQVPLIIEVKPEGDYLATTKKLAEIMKSYTGIYCMESFHPGAVAWYRRNVPSVARGQLSTDYKKNHIKRPPFTQFVLTNLLLNWYSRPDFIAYNYKYASQPSYRLCRFLFRPYNAAWTVRSEEALKTAQDISTIIIFDSFTPT